MDVSYLKASPMTSAHVTFLHFIMYLVSNLACKVVTHKRVIPVCVCVFIGIDPL